MSIGLFLMLLALMVGVLLASSVAMPMDIGIPSSAICTTHPYNTSTCWLGYEFDSSLGYPGEGPPVELEKPFEVDTEANWLEQLEQEKLAIEAIPFISKVDFFCDEHTQNLNKVIATVWCCWDSSSRSFKRVFENCDQSGKKPTHLEAARALRTKLIDSTHARTGHVFDHRAVTRREELMRQQQGAETTEAETAFNRIGLAQARQQAAARQASAAEQAAEAARQAEIAARLACEAAELQAKALRAAADALKPKEPSHKKQKTAFAAGSSSQQAQQTDVCEPDGPSDRANRAKWVEKDPNFSPAAQIHPKIFACGANKPPKFSPAAHISPHQNPVYTSTGRRRPEPTPVGLVM